MRRVAVLFGMILVYGCRSKDLTQAQAALSVRSVEFGRVIVGERASIPLTISNVGSASATFEGAPAIAGANAGDFTIRGSLPLTVAPGQTAAVPLSFAPAGTGSRSGTVSLATDVRDMGTLMSQLTGTGVDPASLNLVLSPSVLDFGSLPVGQSKTLLVTVSNAGEDSAPLGAPSLSGAQSTSFRVASQGAELDGGFDAGLGALAAGATLDLSITFAPQVVGQAVATLTIAVCRLCAPVPVALQGVGLGGDLIFTPQTLDFGAVSRVGSAVSTMALENRGSADAVVASLDVDGGSQFAVLYDAGYASFPMTLAAGTGLQFQVLYLAAGDTVDEVDRAALSAPYATEGVARQPAGASLTGTAGPDCILAIAPASLDFGYAVPSYFTPTRTLALTNNGLDPCIVSGFSFASGSDPGFALAPAIASSLTVAPQATAPVSLKFAPVGLNPWLRQGTLAFATGSPANPLANVPLVGHSQRSALSQGSAWPKFGHDNGVTNLSGVDTTTTTPTLRWRTLIPGFPAGLLANGYAPLAPVLGADDTLYLQGLDGFLYAVDPSTGEVLWSSPVVSNPSNFAGNEFSYFAPVVQADGTILVGEGTYAFGQNVLFAFAMDGGLLWSAPGPSPFVADSPSVGPDGIIYLPIESGALSVGFADGGLSAFLPDGGAMLWTNGSPDQFGFHVTADDGTSFLQDNSTSHQPLRQILTDGGDGWEFFGRICADGGTSSSYSALLVGGGLYVQTAVAIAELSPLDSGLVWEYCIGDAFEGAEYQDMAATPGGGLALVVVLNDPDAGPTAGLARVDPPGVLTWTLERFDVALAPPAMAADGTLYATTFDYPQLLAINGNDGGIRWTYGNSDAGGAYGPPIIGSDGTIYFVDVDGYLNAVR